jgi:hypothetical protein
MVFFVAIAAAVALLGASGYLQLRALATRVAAPKGYRELLDDPGYQRSWLEELGFRTIGELLFPGADKNGPPTVLPALVSPDSVIVARAGALLEREFTLLTTWPDGAYVLTKCPPSGLITTRDSASCSLRSARSGAEALSVHAAAVKDFARHRGLPMQASKTPDVVACYEAAAATWRQQFLRIYLAVIPLGVLGCAAVLVAAVAH